MLVTFLITMMAFRLSAQVPIIIAKGQLRLNDGGFLRPAPKKYVPYIDSLELRLKSRPSDTTTLFYRAFLYSTFNSIVFYPYPGQPKVMQELLKAKTFAEKAVNLKMKDYRLKTLLAQICSELCYQYSDDQSWKFNNKQIIERRSQFNSFKSLTNKYYDDAIILDRANANDYEKLKIKGDYPIK